MRKNFWLRAIAVWLLIAVIESVHGTLRMLLIVPAIGDAPARQLGFVIGAVLILIIAWLTAPWLSAQTRAQQWLVGVLWMVLMFAFEVGLGVAQGFSWSRILQEYDLAQAA